MIQEPPSGLADDDGWDRALGDGSAIPRTRLCDKVAFSHEDIRRGGSDIAIVANIAIVGDSAKMAVLRGGSYETRLSATGGWRRGV